MDYVSHFLIADDKPHIYLAPSNLRKTRPHRSTVRHVLDHIKSSPVSITHTVCALLLDIMLVWYVHLVNILNDNNSTELDLDRVVVVAVVVAAKIGSNLQHTAVADNSLAPC